jgi:glycosyltransferase involved in cell wall biosynthesis
VIAGKKATPTGAALEAAIDRGGLRERVILPGEVTDADRQWLYEHCEAFLFPSLAEGFGFPVLEAMQCGKPVFAARRTSLPEVGGLLVNYFDSFDPDAMATVFHDGMARIARMPDYAAEARARAAAYSWSRAAAAYLELSMPFLERCA